MLTEAQDIVLLQGLGDQDRHIDLLLNLWEELQTSSADAAQAPMFSFLDSALYFAVIYKKRETTNSEGGTSNRWDPASQSDYELNDDVWSVDDDSSYDQPMYQTAGESAIDHSQPPIGIVFLNSEIQANGTSGEISIGIVLDKNARGRGLGRQTVQLLMNWVFEEMKFHRMQAVILDGPGKAQALALFMRLGFGHEGTRRRAVFCSIDGEWKDATYLAILDTEWFMRSYFKPAPRSLWDEMFSRHQREREELLRWEEKLKRTASSETLRVDTAPSRASSLAPDLPTSDLEMGGYVIADPFAASEETLGVDSDDDCLIDRAPSGSPPPESELSVELMEVSDDEERPARIVERQRRAGSSATSRQRDISPDRSSGSHWDLLDSSSSESSSTFECLLGDEME